MFADRPRPYFPQPKQYAAASVKGSVLALDVRQVFTGASSDLTAGCNR